MKVIVIGSGIIGVASAYMLRRGGHSVILLDRRPGPGQETSFANGAILSPSMPEPWNTPGCWRVLLASLGKSSGALQLRVKALPSLARWGLEFLRNSNPDIHERGTISNLRMALRSIEVLRAMRAEALIEYEGKAAGAMRIFRSSAALSRALATAERLGREGLTFRALTPHAAVGLEPALDPIAGLLTGAIHYGSDEVGDAYRFCTGLANRARELGVGFEFGTGISAFEARRGVITAVQTQKGTRFSADQYVLAAGSYSASLVDPLRIRLPVQPVKGYSVTFRWKERGAGLGIPIVDDDLHAAIVPLGRALRIAGTAEFAGFDLTIRPERVRNLMRLAEQVLPRVPFGSAEASSWCGLRPMSPDGVPIIGATRMQNLWLNTGHGHLGWTMAAGSAELLCDLMCGATPSVDPAPYAPARFASRKSGNS